jgi:hypothetical protein
MLVRRLVVTARFRSSPSLSRDLSLSLTHFIRLSFRLVCQTACFLGRLTETVRHGAIGEVGIKIILFWGLLLSMLVFFALDYVRSLFPSIFQQKLD